MSKAMKHIFWMTVYTLNAVACVYCVDVVGRSSFDRLVALMIMIALISAFVSHAGNAARSFAETLGALQEEAE